MSFGYKSYPQEALQRECKYLWAFLNKKSSNKAKIICILLYVISCYYSSQKLSVTLQAMVGVVKEREERLLEIKKGKIRR